MENRFDVIVVGSGMGGMTAASLLAQFFNKRVLVVERHSTFGGLTHEFSRGESSFEVGVHLIGDMEEGSDMRKIFDAVTGSMVKMQKLPNYYDTFIYPAIQLKVDSNPEQYKSDLIKLFPEETNAIKYYFKDVRSYMRLLTFMMMRDSVPAFFKPLMNVAEWIYTHLPNIHIKKYATTAEYLKRRFKSNKLKTLLASQWGYYGVIPDQSAMLVHAVIVNHYLKGAWYPLHGPKKIGDAVADIIKQNKGQVILNNAVLKLIVKNNAAKGIVLTKPDADGNSEYYADVIVSNIGADLTYRKLLPASGIDLPNKIQELKSLWIKDNFLSLYLTFKDTPAKLGFDGGNVWWFRYNDHTKDTCSIHHHDFPAYLFISFPTLKGHTSKKHTVEVLSIVPYSDFETWASKPWFNRGDDYEKLKLEITDKIINEADRQYPGFKDMVDYAELATPLSIEHFTGRVNGSSYGLMTTPERYKIKWLNTTATPIKNLYLSGQDVVTPGIAGAMMGGLAAAGAAIGPGGFIKVMAAVKQAASAFRKFQSADHDYHLVITDIKDETPEAYSIFFNDEKGALKDHKPGQFITLSLDVNGKTEYRSYSLTNCPARNEPPSITIKKIKNGLVSNTLRDRLKIGDAVRIEGPYGKLTWKTSESSKNDYLMIAGGCGVTPIFSLIKTILEEEHNSAITFLYANREVNQIIFRDKLELLADEFRGRFNIFYFLSDEHNPQVGREGFITKTVLENTMKELKNPVFIFMCAPDVMMNLIEKYLKELSFPLKNLFIERFAYKPFNLRVENSVDATVHINVKGKSFDVQVPPGVFLLDPLVSAKVPVKYSCREGHCGVCKARLLKGTVNLIKNDFLSSVEIANGEILLCKSIATSEVIEIVA